MQASDWLLQQIYDRLATNVELALLPSKQETLMAHVNFAVRQALPRFCVQEPYEYRPKYRC